MKQPQTLKEAIEYFANPETCFEYVVHLRWSDGAATETSVSTKTPIPISSTPKATPTIFYQVVTAVPTEAPLITLPSKRVTPQIVPTAIAIPPTAPLTSGQYVASSYRTAKNYYCVTDPEWKNLDPAYRIWSNDAAFFEARGLKLHKPC